MSGWLKDLGLPVGLLLLVGYMKYSFESCFGEALLPGYGCWVGKS